MTTVEHDGFTFLVRDDDTETGHAIPVTVRRPVQDAVAVAVDVALRVVGSFVVRLLGTVSVGAVVVALLAYAQRIDDDRTAAVVMVAVGYAVICVVVVRMAVVETRRLNRVARRRRGMDGITYHAMGDTK